MKKTRYILFLILGLTGIGIIDAFYLTQVHFQNIIPPCTNHLIFTDCGAVLKSSYSVIAGVPLALIGLIHYSLLAVVMVMVLLYNHKRIKQFAVIQTAFGFASSCYFVYLQLFVLHAICLYCMVSALVSTTIFVLAQLNFFRERKQINIFLFGFVYKNIVKKIFFLIDPEIIHVSMLRLGEIAGSIQAAQKITAYAFSGSTPQLTQKIAGITFHHPVGLAAGFDYEAR
ncbi:MAG: vitamin K epoxide reductase family protein, partial [Patescibacteria group bacterium]